MGVSLIWWKPKPATKGIFSPQMSIIHLSDASGASLRAIPPLPALLAFERAASQLSFRRAARDLSLSPSAISHQIRGLEEQFGVKLFVRGARSVRLTADGERYFAKVSAALAALQDAGRDMLRHRRDAHAELWISSLPFFTSRGADPGTAGIQAAPSRAYAAHRGHASICRLQCFPRRRRDPLWPRAFHGTEIRTAGRGEGSAGLRARAGQGWTEASRKICRARF